MKNKKAQSQIITTVLIILLVIALVVIIWHLMEYYNEPEFTIYKEECYLKADNNKLGEYLYNKTQNKTIIDISYDTGMGGYSNPIYKDVKGDFSGEVRVKKIITYPIVNFNISNPYEQGFLWEDLNDCEKVEVEGDEIVLNCSLILDDFNCTGWIMRKKDLTKEWLEGNCEWYNGEPCDDLDCSNRNWEEYKCGNKYIVEIENE